MVLIGGGETGGAGGGLVETVTVDTFADLRATTQSALGDTFVEVLGHTTVDDGGGGQFRHVATGADSQDDDNGMVIVASNGDKWERYGWKRPGRINVNWMGLFPDGTDRSAELINILERHPDSELFWPQGDPFDRYDISVDINEGPDRATQEANLGSRNAGQIASWEYTPKWFGEAPQGEPEQSGTIISVAQAATKGYAVRGGIRAAAPGSRWLHGVFHDIRFWGDTGDSSGAIVVLDDVGSYTEFKRCEFLKCDVGVHLRGTWNVTFTNCKIGSRTSPQLVDIGVWEEAFDDRYCGWNTYQDCTIGCDKAGVFSENRENSNPAHGDTFLRCDFENGNGLAYYGIHTGSNSNPVSFRDNYMKAINDSGGNIDFTEYSAKTGVISTAVNEAFRFEGSGFVEIDETDHLVKAARDVRSWQSEITGTNLVVDASDNTKVTPDGHTPEVGDVGFDLEILTVGTGPFTLGSYQILGQDGSQWTLDRSPGPTNSSGAQWHAMDDQAGPVVYIKHNRWSGSHDVDKDSILTIGTSHVDTSDGGVINHPTDRVFKANETKDNHAGARINGHYIWDAPEVENRFESQNDIDSFNVSGGATAVARYGVTPRGQMAAEVFIPTAGTPSLDLNGPIAAGTNYWSADDTYQRWTAFTFAVRSMESTPISIALRNSRRINAFQDDITLEDGRWHTYCVVGIRGEGEMYYAIENTTGSDITIQIGDVQAVAFTNRPELMEFLDARRFATKYRSVADGGLGGLHHSASGVLDGGRDFGIAADGTDETVKLQRAFDAVCSGNFSKLQLPSGVIRISSTITLDRARGVTIQGTGRTGGIHALPWTEAMLGGTIIEWDGPAGGVMIDIDESRYFEVKSLDMANTHLDQTGNAASACMRIAAGSSYGNGHMYLDSIGYKLLGAGVACIFGTVQADTNAADVRFHNCVIWGDDPNLTEGGIVVNHDQGVNYNFENCVFAFLDTIAKFNYGGSCRFKNCDSFGCKTGLMVVNQGDNNGTFSWVGGRFDDKDDVPFCVFDASTGNAEPKHFTGVDLTFKTRSLNMATADPIFKLRDNAHATIEGSNFTTCPLVRFYGSTKTALTPTVEAYNCEIPGSGQASVAGPHEYLKVTGGVSSGKLVQIDNTTPGVGAVRLRRCHVDQRPVPDWELGLNPGSWEDPDDFVQWCVAEHSPVGLWMHDEGSGTTVTNHGSGNASYTVDSGMLHQHAESNVPHRTGMDMSAAARTTLGAFDTGIDLVMSTSDYTFAMALHKNSVHYNGTYTASASQIFMMITPDSGQSLTTENYADFPYIPGTTNADLAILDNNDITQAPATTIIDNINRGGWCVLVLTWDQSTQEVDAWLNGVHVDSGSTTFPTVRTNWAMAGSSNVWLGGWKSASAGRQWEGFVGPVVIIPAKLTSLEAVELSARLMMSEKEVYAKATP